MSTRCAIIVKVKEEHIGKTLKFNKDSLPCKLSEWDDETDVEKSEEVKINKPYLGIYCHHDGYLDGVGMVLKEQYTDYETILNLVLGGFCSSVWHGYVRHYANRKERVTWDDIKPIQGDTPFEVGNKIGHNGYVYLFEDGKWKVQKGDKNEFVEYDENGLV